MTRNPAPYQPSPHPHGLDQAAVARSVLEAIRGASLRGLFGSTRRAWSDAWHQAAQKLPVGELPICSIWVNQWSEWTELGAEGSIIWTGELLLTSKRFVKINPSGVSQIRLRDLDGAGYRELRYGLFKAACYVLLTTHGQISHVFSLPERAGVSRKYGQLVGDAMAALSPGKFE